MSSLWNRVALERRAAVLACLYEVRNKLWCTLTLRSGQISYAGDAAFPGGRADPGETSLQVARREAHEEIGLPEELPLEHMFSMPAYLSSKYHCVVPEVVLYRDPQLNPLTNLPSIINPRPTNGEVLRVFSVELEGFLCKNNHVGRRLKWGGMPFHQHYFTVPAPEKQVGEPAEILVWGLTASIIIDIARKTLGREPEFAHRRPGQFGDQQLIEALTAKGLFDGPRPDSINFRQVLGKDSPTLQLRV